jgi:RNA polymerase sigma factor (sigma-70 family)
VTSGNATSDADLVMRAKSGDRAAFDILVTRHKDILYRFIRRYVGQADDAYDILQNCFVSAWEGLDRFDPARPLLAWLRVIALNKCRDFGRRQKVRRVFLKAFASEQSGQDSMRAQLGGEADDDALRLANLDKAIAELPARYKEPLLLTVVSGLSHQEAAEVLGTSSKAVEMRLYRARRRILQAMAVAVERDGQH